MWETIYSGEAVEIDITQGEDFEQSWTFSDEDVVIPFITDGWEAKAAVSITDRTGRVITEDMTVVLVNDGSLTVSLSRVKTSLLPVSDGKSFWTLILVEPVTGLYNVVFNAPIRVHAGAVKSIG